MSTPYTYIIKHTPSGKVYYGCRYAKNCDPSDLWTKYFTSSKHVKKLIESTGINSFEIEVRKTFNNREDCLNWENRVLNRLNVLNRQELFINKTNNRAISAEASSRGSVKAHELYKERDKQLGRKMGLANKGRKHSAETNAKKAQPGNKHKLGFKESEETKLKKSIAHTGGTSGMLGKTFAKVYCIECRHETVNPALKNHYKYKHANIFAECSP